MNKTGIAPKTFDFASYGNVLSLNVATEFMQASVSGLDGLENSQNLPSINLLARILTFWIAGLDYGVDPYLISHHSLT